MVCWAHWRLARWTASPWSRGEARVAVAEIGDAQQTARHPPAKGGLIRSIAMIVIVDVVAPLAAYSLLRSAGMTAVTAAPAQLARAGA